MLESFRSGKFEYKRLSLDEQKARGILGRLKGIIADTKNPTRNGRKYSKELWEKVFNSDIMQEKIKNHLVLGELGHPVDREEIDIERAAICLAEQPKIGDDGNIYGVFDILSTPSGRILKSLCDYGCNIGVSSRGSGDLYTDEDGNEAVDPNTYNCECFDAVVVPAVEAARLQYVTEALDIKKYNKTLKQRLTEELNNASDSDKKVMEESLSDLGINLEEDSEIQDQEEPDEIDLDNEESQEVIEDCDLDEKAPKPISNKELLDKVVTALKDKYGKDEWQDQLFKLLTKVGGDAITAMADAEHLREDMNEPVETNCSDIEDSEDEEVVNDKDLAEELQQLLLKNSELEKDNLSLQEKLSVCNAKENKLNEELNKYKECAANLSETAKKVRPLNSKVNQLSESLERKDKIITSNRSRLDRLFEDKKDLSSQLKESISNVSELEQKVNTLTEELENSKKTLESSKKTLSEKLNLITRYKKALKESKDAYISAKAENYRVKKEDVLANLTESYKLSDVDSVCRELSERNYNMSKLPFKITEDVKFETKKSSNESIIGGYRNSDDDISDYLLNIVK